MKRLLLGIFICIGITSVSLPVWARVTSVVANKKTSNSICSAINSDQTRCHSKVITITENSSSQPDLPEQGAEPMQVCSLPQPAGYARCHSVVLVDNSAKPLVANIPSGYGPTEFRTAYQLTGTAKAPTTIAIVDAYDSPTIENDLNVYSQTYGLPSCTTDNGCFTKVNQSGQQNSYPLTDTGWALEISLDVEVAHAICQNCNILLVEANSSSLDDLGKAENTAAKLGATVISNSYGVQEFQGETGYDQYFNHPGITITVSSGDSGYGVQYPAASPYVTAVGGTTLSLKSDNTRNSETVWSGSGSGCSVQEPKPGWQIDNGCTGRTVVDVSADADPNTGAAVYDSTGTNPGWMVVGGTSLSAPLVAGIYALAGNSGSNSKIGASYLYSNTSVPSLYNVKTGSNGNCGSYLCTGGPIYNGPTGLGTPIGTDAF